MLRTLVFAFGAVLLLMRSAGAGQLQTDIWFGHGSAVARSVFLKLVTNELAVLAANASDLEPSPAAGSLVWQGQAGGGTVARLQLTLAFADVEVKAITNVQSIWRYLLEHSDADTARRLARDPAYRPDPRKLTVQLDSAGTSGFSVTVDQLLQNKTFWIPDLDVFVSAGEPPVSFAQHQQELARWPGRRALDEVEREPEASYEQFTARWEDMGSPAYRNPAAPPPGHIVCLSWPGALHKFGVDRGAGVRGDLGNPDRFRFWFDFGELAQLSTQSWRGQRLAEGLPIICTTFEQDAVRYEVEQFVFPLAGSPDTSTEDPIVLVQKLKVTNLGRGTRSVELGLNHQRLPANNSEVVSLNTNRGVLWLQDSRHEKTYLTIEGAGLRLEPDKAEGAGTNRFVLSLVLPASKSRELVIKLPSPSVRDSDFTKLSRLDYARCRKEAVAFWSDWLAKGAQFVVPDQAVNDLFRASLWHALRLPRRHGNKGRIDLPYSNFAYDQNGVPWPVNQGVYVDYMLYDLRGYHKSAGEDLLAIYRENQEPNGHIKGFANWGVYTPSMLYAVAQHFLLSGDRAAFEALLPQTLKALDWCLSEMKQATESRDPANGLVLAPLNDLSHEPRAWAYNQAYFVAGPELLARALAEAGHPRAEECRAAARRMRDAVQQHFGEASVRAPLVQLRDHTWIPYVPSDALASGRLLQIWYPTDVDTGALHLPRLKALDPAGPLGTYLLHDHEDNLFLHGWGMANEPVYNQHATAYLLRDDPIAVVRAFYSMMACAFSHSVFEPVEHRWAWGQYFGPPSTDGAWFELYRNMLIHEREDGALVLLQATPRKWLEDGKQIHVQRAPTYFGPISFQVRSRAAARELRAKVEMPSRKHPEILLLRFRHPAAKPIRAVTVNGAPWSDFDVQKEWVVIRQPKSSRYEIIARY